MPNVFELALQYGLTPCTEQFSAGGEAPCCRWKWAQVQAGGMTIFGRKNLEGLPTTACLQDMGTACAEGQEEARLRAEARGRTKSG